MSPAWIRPRTVQVSDRNPRGRTFQVLYRTGGREATPQSAGTFKTEKEAKLRRDLVAGWLARGLDPRTQLAAAATTTPARTYRQWAAAYQASRLDQADDTTKNLHTHLNKLNKLFGDRDPHTLTVPDQIEAVAELARTLAPSSLTRYWATHRLVLDFAGVEPNPARHRTVKLPAVRRVEPQPPTARQLLALLDKMTVRWRLPLIVAEQTAMTVGELTLLEWGDVDTVESRFRLRRATVKAGLSSRARWVQVPDWLMGFVAATCPLEDRAAGRRVFPGFTRDGARDAMRRACATAGVPLFSPHDLRHRRLSLWHGQGVPVRELTARAGHTKASMTLDVYSHVLLDPAEASQRALERLLVRRETE